MVCSAIIPYINAGTTSRIDTTSTAIGDAKALAGKLLCAVELEGLVRALEVGVENGMQDKEGGDGCGARDGGSKADGDGSDHNDEECCGNEGGNKRDKGELGLGCGNSKEDGDDEDNVKEVDGMTRFSFCSHCASVDSKAQ